LNQYEYVLEDFSEEETDSSTLIPRIQYNMAWEYHQLGQYDDSKQKVLETIEHEKSNDFLKAKAYILLGVNEAALGDTAQALECLEDAISLNPGSCIENMALVNISLLLNPESYEYVTICQGESYHEWFTSGIYARTAQSITGEDSVVATFLQINPTYDIIIDTVVTEGESYNGWTEPGSYQQTFQTAAGCDSIVTIFLEVLPYGVDVQQQANNNVCRIYPNPNNGRFRLRFNEKITDAITIEIYSITGRKVYEEKVSYVLNDHLIQLRGIPKGLYILYIQNGETAIIEKIVVE
jgi:tetratricopeptide (TPR) repeat protein